MDKKIWAIRKTSEQRLKKLCPEMLNKSGIYIWYRPIYKVYVGQSVALINRNIDHLLGHDHIALSIKKHGLYNKEKNPLGWKLNYFYVDTTQLDEKERETILKYNNGENELYNTTSGGQGVGKIDINERKESRKYRDGLKQGYENCLNEIKEYFYKYLSFGITPINSTKKDGTIKEVYARKLKEFTELLERGNYGNEKDK